ncbi:MAG: hypothetical protein ACLFVU_10020 [Phycisphaerae bacterium]
MIGKYAASAIGAVGFLLTILAATPPVQGEEKSFVWWEGENPQKTNFPKQTWFDPKKGEADKLSGGDWLTNMGKRKPGQAEAFATYRITVPADGEYAFWARKMWKHGPFRWRFDEGEWHTVGRDIALADSVSLRTHVSVNWASLGKVKLDKGAHTFELRLLAEPGESLTAAFDAFLLTRNVFFPGGKLKPGERSGKTSAGHFAWEPAADGFKASPIDLRHLNEKLAGQSGWVKTKGDDFLLGDGTPVRFWAVNISARNIGQSRESIDYMARKLAKLGVNMVRYHSPLFTDRKNPKKVDPQRLDDLMYTIHALKQQGIYTKVSFYFPLWFNASQAGLEGFSGKGNTKPFALLLFDEKMQGIWKGWVKQLLTTKSKYSGKTLAQEPGLAIIEIVNEDSLFFWTFTRKNVPAVYWTELEKQFGTWLVGEYGSLGKAVKAWGGKPAKRDDLKAGRMEVMDAWHMTADGLKVGGESKKKRIADQVEFLARTQAQFYETGKSYITRELGYGGLISCSNWRTADENILGAIERWTYTAGDVIDRHGYFGPPHKGDGASYSVRVGHTFKNRPAVLEPGKLPLQVKQVAGFPHIISELNWPQPNRYRADMTFLSAGYGAQQGLDGLFFFALGSNYVRDTSINKFQIAGPEVSGTFPATALVYRKQLIARPAPVLVTRLSTEDLFDLKGEADVEAAALDKLRQADGPTNEQAGSLLYYVGPVMRVFANRPGSVEGAAGYADPKGGTIVGRGGMKWDYKKGLVTMDRPKVAGLAGFLSKANTAAFTEGAVRIRSGNQYGAVLVVPLDDKPLKSSRKILVQAMTEARPHGFNARGGKIASLGSFPFNVKNIDVTINVGAGMPVTVTDLDENGYARGKSRRVVGSIKISPDAVYTVIER